MKGYGFLLFAKNIGKNTTKKLNSKLSQILLDHAKQSATDMHKTFSKGLIQKTTELTGDSIASKITNNIYKVLQGLLHKQMVNR